MRETKLWTWFMLAGLVILVLLGLHMLVAHMGGLTGIGVADRTADSVTEANSQARDAGLFYPIVYLILLAAALFHGLYGLRVILFELGLKMGAQKAVNALLLLLGLGLFGFGSWGIFAAHALYAGRG